MRFYVLLNIFLCFSHIAIGQIPTELATIEFGSKNLTLEQPLLISVVLRDVENRPSIIFPDIKDLEKRSKSATSSESTVDGKKVVIQTISQEYYAKKPGKYIIPEFSLSINGTRLHSEETFAVFREGTGTENENAGERLEETSALEEVDLAQGVFLSVQADKRRVFVREGFALKISLYIAENAPVEMEFFKFNEQLQSILKALRPANCWEENVGIEEIAKRTVTVRGRRYAEYNMYQATFFPITTEAVRFPAIKLDMLITDNSGAVNVEKKVVRGFYSKPLTVLVNQLPNHPLRDQVAVGRYELKEKLSATLVYPGESIRYMFKVEGVGNIAAIPAPVTQISSSLDIYTPEVSQLVKRSDKNVAGNKTFDYFVVPRQDGVFQFARYFQWIYFSTEKQNYDTLRSRQALEVKGEDYKLVNLDLAGSTGLYDNIENLDSSKESFDYRRILRNVTNGIVVLLLVTMIWIFRK